METPGGCDTEECVSSCVMVPMMHASPLSLDLGSDTTCWNRPLLESTVGSFVDQPSEMNISDEPWNGEKEMMLLCHVKQCDVFSFSLRNI
jgi:hypothetical protein